jgi:hypothetical protein
VVRTEYSTKIGCPPDDLWLFLDEPELQKQWMKGLVANEISDPGGDRTGATFQMRIREGARLADYEGEILVHDRPTHLAVRFWGGSLKPCMVVRVDYRLTPVGDATRLDIVSELVAGEPGPLMRLILPLVKLFNLLQLRGFMKSLKRLAEAGE